MKQSSDSDISRETIKGFRHLMEATIPKKQQTLHSFEKTVDEHPKSTTFQEEKDEPITNDKSYSLLFNRPIKATIEYVSNVLKSSTSPDDLKLEALELISSLIKNDVPPKVLSYLEVLVEGLTKNSDESEEVQVKAIWILMIRFKRKISVKEKNCMTGTCRNIVTQMETNDKSKELERKSKTNDAQLNKPKSFHHQLLPVHRNSPQSTKSLTKFSSPTTRTSGQSVKSFAYFSPSGAISPSFIPFSPDSTQSQPSSHLLPGALPPPPPPPLLHINHHHHHQSSDLTTKTYQHETSSIPPANTSKQSAVSGKSSSISPPLSAEPSAAVFHIRNEIKEKSGESASSETKARTESFYAFPVITPSGQVSTFFNNHALPQSESGSVSKPFFHISPPPRMSSDASAQPVCGKEKTTKLDSPPCEADGFVEVDKLLSNLSKKESQSSHSPSDTPRSTFELSKHMPDEKKKQEEKLLIDTVPESPFLELPENALIATSENEIPEDVLKEYMEEKQRNELDHIFALKLGIITNGKCELCGLSVPTNKVNEHIQLHSEFEEYDESRVQCPVCDRTVLKSEFEKHSHFHKLQDKSIDL
eukprot:MONOS_80.1-p1 / transcript=MONOS_80.1 / gene=MONOS_80 / organism=Monocercomonoides_exilis_PA203 / gene_product=unspecified product / transcript_product=unspecified product / location=Mono_scaffold00002:2734-4556(-) / protein_length=588 / sequence_SO=supercontig / SO=protein_coding / is_pseudo=false